MSGKAEKRVEKAERVEKTPENINQMLFIKNVKLSDCVSIDDMFEKNLLDQANDPCTVVPSQDEKIPCIFKGLAAWPKKTSLLCWNCTLAFDDIPVFVPKSVEPIDGGACNLSAEPVSRQEVEFMWNYGAGRIPDVFGINSQNRSRTSKYAIGCEGCFCSFNCALAYLDQHYTKPADNFNKRGMLSILFKEMCGIPSTMLYKSPPHFHMKQYGGSTTVQEYKKIIADLQAKSGITKAMKIKWRETSFREDGSI